MFTTQTFLSLNDLQTYFFRTTNTLVLCCCIFSECAHCFGSSTILCCELSSDCYSQL